jgi:hypothetical protein
MHLLKNQRGYWRFQTYKATDFFHRQAAKAPQSVTFIASSGKSFMRITFPLLYKTLFAFSLFMGCIQAQAQNAEKLHQRARCSHVRQLPWQRGPNT